MTPKPRTIMKPENYFLRIFLSLIFSCTLLIVNCYSQSSITWQRTYDDSHNWHNEAYDICISTANTYFIVGRSDFASIPQIVRIRDNGDTIWNKEYPSIINFKPWSCVSTGNGTFVTVGFGSNGRTKIDSSGSIIWNPAYDTMQSELFHVIKNSDNTFISCGSALDPIQGYVIKFDSFGNKIWEKFYPAGELLRFYSITQAYNNGYLMCGYENDGINFEYHAIILRIDSLGNELWRKFPINSTFSQSLNTIRKFRGNYVTVGGSDTARIIKFNTNGDVTYQKLIPRPEGVTWGNISYIYGEVYQNDKIIFYRNQGNVNSITFSVIMKLDSNFNQLASLRLESNNSATFIKSVLPLSNNDLIFVGEYNNGDFTKTNFYAIRSDSNLYSPPLKIINLSTIVPNDTKLLKNYPNPFNPNTMIKFEIKKEEYVEIEIYSSLGQIIDGLVSQTLKPGIYETEWKAEEYPSGVYFCILRTRGLTSTLKLILLK